MFKQTFKRIVIVFLVGGAIYAVAIESINFYGAYQINKLEKNLDEIVPHLWHGEKINRYSRLIRELKNLTNFIPFNPKVYALCGMALSQISSDENISEQDLKELFETAETTRENILKLAERYFSRAVNLNPTNAEYHFRLYSVYRKLRQYDQSYSVLMQKKIDDYQKLYPSNEQFYFYIVKDFLDDKNELLGFKYLSEAYQAIGKTGVNYFLYKLKSSFFPEGMLSLTKSEIRYRIYPCKGKNENTTIPGVIGIRVCIPKHQLTTLPHVVLAISQGRSYELEFLEEREGMLVYEKNPITTDQENIAVNDITVTIDNAVSDWYAEFFIPYKEIPKVK